MGISDFWLIPKMSQDVAKQINNLENGSKIAWLGQKHPNMSDTDAMYKEIMKLVEVKDLHNDFYDLYNDDNVSDNSYIWDVNSEWDFEGYDLIVAVRIFYACNSASQLLRNVKKMVSMGQNIVCDLMAMSENKKTFEIDDSTDDIKKEMILYGDVDKASANGVNVMFDNKLGKYRSYVPLTEDDCEIFAKPKNSKTIIPMLASTWTKNKITNVFDEYKFAAKPTHDDQVLDEESLKEGGIKFTPLSSFRDGVKGRIYTVCEFSELHG